MTYLDPNHTRTQSDLGRWIVRALIVAALLAFGWFALTVGLQRDGNTEIVSEPVPQSPARS
ncbi:hypothetical protein [Pelagibacterium lentulum]|uniref:Uncharacterized protein n=1 Tax=Pelagibacterium lentulum TaxID=2029865 RepID=A0A916R9C8_9HYPH|nr:hypothetical protein [Pelagibacterium lentulum]GGA45681.1 hypothetical protein GCM10011499_14260 [Pelagibacterium lentulum]